MANQSKKGSAFLANTGLKAADTVFALTSTDAFPNNALVTVGNLLGNSQADHVVPNGHVLIVKGNTAQANSTANSTVVQGTIWSDGSFIYVADAVGHVKRAALASF